MARKTGNYYDKNVNILGQTYSGMRKVRKERMVQGRGQKPITHSAALLIATCRMRVKLPA